MKKIIIIFAALALIICISSCGYKFSKGGNIPGGITKLSIGIFENQSSEAGAENLFTSSLINELVNTTNAEIVDKKEADAFIKGRINSITFGTLTRKTDESVTEIRISAIVDVKMVSSKSGKIIWSVHNFSDYEDYAVSNSNISDEAAKRGAVRKIAKRIAEKIASRMRDNF